MPKNTGKGGKNFRRGKNDTEQSRRDVTLKKDGEERYACITKVLGNYRFGLTLDDDTQATGVLRGCMRNKQYVVLGDIVLVQVRGEEDGHVDMIHKYKSDEVRDLLKQGHITPELQNAAQERQATHVGASAITFTTVSAAPTKSERLTEGTVDGDGLFRPVLVNPNRKVGGIMSQIGDSEEDEEPVRRPYAHPTATAAAAAAPSSSDEDEEENEEEEEEEDDLLLAAAAYTTYGKKTDIEKQRNKRGTGAKKSKVDSSAYADI
jgi:translation initiation factor 1A